MNFTSALFVSQIRNVNNCEKRNVLIFWNQPELGTPCNLFMHIKLYVNARKFVFVFVYVCL